MNTVEFPCPCGVTLQVDEQLTGKKARCANCGAVHVVPDPARPETARGFGSGPAAPKEETTPKAQVKTVKWLEPSIMKRAGNNTVNLWISLAIIFGMGIVGVILRAIVRQGDTPRPYWMVFLGCAGVGFVFDCARRMLSFVPSFVIVSQQGINLNTLIGHGAHFSFWPWHSIGSGKLEVATVGSRSVPVLTLYSYDQQPIGTIGMPLSAPVKELAAAFSTMGKPLH